jgi:hypothetical protein
LNEKTLGTIEELPKKCSRCGEYPAVWAENIYNYKTKIKYKCCIGETEFLKPELAVKEWNKLTVSRETME